MTMCIQCRRMKLVRRDVSASHRRIQCRLYLPWTQILVHLDLVDKVASLLLCEEVHPYRASAGRVICQSAQLDQDKHHPAGMAVVISAQVEVALQVSSMVLWAASRDCLLQMQLPQAQVLPVHHRILIPNHHSISALLIVPRKASIQVISSIISRFHPYSPLTVPHRKSSSSMITAMVPLKLRTLITRIILQSLRIAETTVILPDSCLSHQRCISTSCSILNSNNNSSLLAMTCYIARSCSLSSHLQENVADRWNAPRRIQ